MIERIGEVERVTAIAPLLAPGLLVTGFGTCATIGRRQRRLKWLASLHAALGEARPLANAIDESGTDVGELVERRADIADALTMVAELRSRVGDGVDESQFGDRSIAVDLARRIAQDGEQSMRIHARISAVTVRRLVDGAR